MGRRSSHGGPDGLAVVDKAAGWTSHDVVAKARGLLGTRKVGHSGTLDPDATGVLLLGVGKVTRLLRFLGLPSKTYTGVVVLGTATSTLDASGEVTGTWDMAGVTVAEVREAAAALTGEILQVPPMVSAIQVDGRRLHELAREGIEVERAARPVTVHRFEVGEAVTPGCFPIEVECSSGTYIRSLAADVGTALGGGAHLRDLRRTAIGSFTEDQAVPLDALRPEALLSPAAALRDLPAVTVDATTAADVAFGKVLAIEALGVTGPGPWPVLDEAGTLLAVYEPHRGGSAKPTVVLPRGGG
ncbi:MAG TPA: tRNA pseudouridine(55) synthase TruB [Acidimicrobiales bacterium]|nr:tRNA pseudouridine(55) synthase TruB [Acidimicrobiales bacterium]